MQITNDACSKTSFGKTKDGEDVDMISLKNLAGTKARIITYGATLVGVDVPDRTGTMANVILGFEKVADYENKSPYFGATVGRVANRIARGTFDLNGKTYTLAINNGPNTLHGGLKAFDKRVWTLDRLEQFPPSATFRLHSKDMEEGFPGNVDVEVTYSLSDDNEIKITYAATTDQDTPLNLTNHAYFNLAGAGRGTILDHTLVMHCPGYTPVDKDLIPTGEILSVSGTPFDFALAQKIGARIADVSGGYDHNFCIERKVKGGPDKVASEPGLVLAATAQDPVSGRVLEMLTTEPGVQFYTGNFLDGTISGTGGRYEKHGGFTFEAQHYPDAVHQPNFPSIILHPGDKYSQVTVYRFLVR